MNSLTLTTDESNVKTTNPWLVTVLKFANRIEFFKPFEQFSVPMKEVNYTVLHKLQTLVASIASGCQYTSEINDTLVPDTVAAGMIGLSRFPDQSQINRLLTRCSEDNVQQLQTIHRKLFTENHMSQAEGSQVVVDIDQSGLVANGKTYELAKKGYFPNKRGLKGYQLSVAFAGKTGQALSLYLEPGNTHCLDRFDDLVSDTAAFFKDSKQKLIIRADSGYGTEKNIEFLRSKRVHFIIKGYSSRQSHHLAPQVKQDDWQEVDRLIHVAEVKTKTPGLRVIVCEIITQTGRRVYSHLLTDIDWMSPVELFHFYNERQTIEAFFKVCKNTYGIKNLRTTNFNGIYVFLWLVLITHNLITWMKGIMFRGTQLEKAGIRFIIAKIGSIKVKIREANAEVEFLLPELSKMVSILVEAFCSSRPEQMEFPFFT